MKFKINKKKLPYFIAEISANHKGSILHAKKLIKLAKDSGADAVKLQTYSPSSMTLDSRKKFFKIDKKKWGSNFLWDLYERAKTPLSWHKELFDYSNKLRILCFSTPFDLDNVDELEKLNCPIYKISSFENNHFPLLKRLAQTKKPLIMSTGISNLKQITKSVNFLRRNNCGKLHLLYCVSNYPSNVEDFNLNNILILKKKFKLDVGFSDHSKDDFVSYIAVDRGAKIIEKHITTDNQAIDAKFSKKTNELKLYIKNLKKINFLNHKKSYFLPKKNTGKKFQRSIFVTQNLNIGDRIKSDNIRAIRPNNGIDASKYFSIIGKKIKKQIKKNSPLTKSHF